MMILWLAGLAVLILYRTRIVAFNGAYLDKSTADPIKGIFIFTCTLQTDSDLVGCYSLDGFQMDITKTAFGFTAPDEGLSSINLKGITTQTPACELHTDVVDDSLTLQFVGNPSRGKTTVVLPFREFVVIETVGGMLRVVACLGRNDPYALLFFLIGRRKWCRPAV